VYLTDERTTQELVAVREEDERGEGDGDRRDRGRDRNRDRDRVVQSRGLGLTGPTERPARTTGGINKEREELKEDD
jgi:hypothetical protein